MFNCHMSYAEIQKALKAINAENRPLTEKEAQCIYASASEPFFDTILSLYPLEKAERGLLSTAVTNVRSKMHLDVHDEVYLLPREKTKACLAKKYPPSGSINVIGRVRRLIKDFLHDKECEQQLQQAESARYESRKKDYESGKLKTLSPIASLKAIKSDFLDFLAFLTDQHQAAATNDAWSVLNSVFKYTDSILDPKQKKAAEELLFLTLDSARTSHHADNQKIFEQKDYSCLLGLQQHFLDAYLFVFDKDTHTPGPLDITVPALIKPFIIGDIKNRVASPLLLEIYKRAAGYKNVRTTVLSYALKDKTNSESLREGYEKEIAQSTPPLNEVQQDRLLKIFQACLGSLNFHTREILEGQYSKVIDFLKRKDAIELVTVTHEELLAPKTPENTALILENMLKIGPFIDKAHLDLIIALQSADNSLQPMDDLLQNGGYGYTEVTIPRKEDFTKVYKKYLETKPYLKPFYDSKIITAAIHQHIEKSNSYGYFSSDLSCPQDVLCEWINEHGQDLTSSQGETLAVLCAQAGYTQVLAKLFNKPLYKASVKTIDTKTTHASLLNIAVRAGHTDVVKFLLDQKGIDINQLDIYLFSILFFLPIKIPYHKQHFSALMIAAREEKIDILEYLISKKADVNVQNEYGSTPLMEAASKGRLNAVKTLLKNGAKIDQQNKNGETALMLAIKQGHDNIATTLIDEGADIFMKNNYGENIAIQAIKSNNIRLTKRLLEYGVNLDYSGTRTISQTAILSLEFGLVAILTLFIMFQRFDNYFYTTAMPLSIVAINLTATIFGCYFSGMPRQFADLEPFLMRVICGSMLLINLLAFGHPLAAPMAKFIFPVIASMQIFNEIQIAVSYWSRDNTIGLVLLFEALRTKISSWLSAAPNPKMKLEEELINNIRAGKSDLTPVISSAPTVSETTDFYKDWQTIKSLKQFSEKSFNINLLSDGRSALDVAIDCKNEQAIKKLVSCPALAPCVIKKSIKRCANNIKLSHILPLLKQEHDYENSSTEQNYQSISVISSNSPNLVFSDTSSDSQRLTESPSMMV